MKRMTWVVASVAVLTATSVASAAPDVEAGKAKAKSCAGCHGANGEGKAKYPAIAGMDQKKFAQDMQDYKSGKKANGMMKSAASKLSDDDIQNLAAYFGSLKK